MLSGFELFPRWVPLISVRQVIASHTITQSFDKVSGRVLANRV